MAFEPLDWEALAGELALLNTEAALRTAIGRLYYAMFVKSRDSLAAKRLIQPDQSDGDHRRVVEGLKMNKRAAAGVALDNLRRLRNNADYAMGSEVNRQSFETAKAHAAQIRRMSAGDWLPS